MSTPSARRLTDEQLRTAQLVIGNPLDLEGITSDSPDKSYTPVVVAEYHIEAGQPQVRCSYCDQHQPHQHGFVVEFCPPSRHLVGSICGAAKLDLQFSAAKNKHSELVSRQRYIQRLDTLIGQLHELTASCNAVLFGEPLKALEAKAQELQRVAGDAFIRLRALALSGAPLMETVQVRDRNAELQRDERRNDGKEGPPIYRHETVPLGPVRGRAMLDADQLRSRIHAYKLALEALPALTQGGTDQVSTGKLKQALAQLDRSRDDANRAIEAMNVASEFFAVDHLRLLGRWAAGASKVELSETGGQLYANGVGVQPLAAAQTPPLLEVA